MSACGGTGGTGADGGPRGSVDGGSNGADGGSVADGGNGGNGMDGGSVAGLDPAECGVQLTQSGVLDVDLPTVLLRGRVTLNGGALPAAVGHPRLVLRRADGRDPLEGGLFVDLAVAARNGGQYQARVIPGDYELRYAYAECGSAAYPCQQQVRLRTLALRQSGALDVDLAPVNVTGRVTLDGAALPNIAYDRGNLLLRGRDDGSTGRLIRIETLAATDRYTSLVFPGTYDLLYDNPDARSLCTGATFPCQNAARWREDVSLRSAGALDVDLQTVRITGTVTLAGAPLPSASYHRGRVLVRSADGSTGMLAHLDDAATATPRGRYDVHLLAGTYDLLYDNEDALGTCTGSPYPCQLSMPFQRSVAMLRSGALDVDVPTVRITGRATLNGAAIGASPYTRGKLHLRPERGASSDEGAQGVFVALDRLAAPSGTYDVRVIPARYTLLYDNIDTGERCNGSVLPCQRSFPWRSNTNLTATGALDLDLRTVRITGRVTLNGAVPPAASYSRGLLELRGPGQSSGIFVELDRVAATGGHYDVRGFAATYDVLYTNNDTASRCTGAPYPCQGRVVWRTGQALTASGALDVDLQPVLLSGTITMDGQDLPASPTGARGEVLLVGADGSLGELVDLDAIGGDTYEAWVFPQRYNVYAGFRPGREVRCPQGIYACPVRMVLGCEDAQR